MKIIISYKRIVNSLTNNIYRILTEFTEFLTEFTEFLTEFTEKNNINSNNID